MHDDQLRSLLRTLDHQTDPDPVFADALFQRLSLVARNEGRSRGVMVLLAAALLTATLAAGAVLGSGVVSLPWTSDRTPDPVAEATPTPTPVASPTAATPVGIPTDSVVRTTVEGLQLRASFSTSAESLGRLPNGSIGLVVDGPRVAEGMPWYLVAAPGLAPNTGCAPMADLERLTCPLWFGWIAGADVDGTPWLAQIEVPGGCPDRPGVDVLGPMQPAFRIACYGRTELTLRGYYPELPDGAAPGDGCVANDGPAGWLICQGVNEDYLVADAIDAFAGGLRMSVDPTTDVVLPTRGQWLEVTGHFDDPASASCGDAPGSGDPALLIHFCRMEFVVDVVRPVSGP